jgi:hypothetical protein
MGLIEWIGAILGGIAINLVASELFAWGPRLSECLTRWAVRRLPVEMQERMREEWAGHLHALTSLSRTFAAIGFVLAAYRIKVSFDRDARGALTLREWLALKPIVVMVMTSKAAIAMARAMSEPIVFSTATSKPLLTLGPEDAMIRSNLMAKASAAWRRTHERMFRLYGTELQARDHPLPEVPRTSSGEKILRLYGRLELHDHPPSKVSRTNSGDIAIESADSTLLFRIRSTLPRRTSR